MLLSMALLFLDEIHWANENGINVLNNETTNTAGIASLTPLANTVPRARELTTSSANKINNMAEIEIYFLDLTYCEFFNNSYFISLSKKNELYLIWRFS